MVKAALRSAALLMLMLLLITGTRTENISLLPIDVVVENSLVGKDPVSYTTDVASRGILLGALKRLMDSNANFKFTYREDPNYGPFLESVNGLAGNEKEQTYWELLVQTSDGKIIRPDVGIGCYIPRRNEKIILKFTKW